MFVKKIFSAIFLIAISLAIISCSEDSPTENEGLNPKDPNTASKVSIDRFSSEAGNLFVRTPSNGLPESNAPINFDIAPFITKGLGPNGEKVQYYNFDVQPIVSAPIYVLFKDGEDSPVDDQLNIIDVVPGDQGYNDFWNVNKVIVPSDYTANTITNVNDLFDSGYSIEKTNIIVNCPVVPEGSTAKLRYKSSESKELTRGWYNDQVVFYFNFSEKELMTTSQGSTNVPLAEILVSFNINPDQQGGGPASGFVTENNSDQTHNVVDTLPEDNSYSPLWDVDIYDNNNFEEVMDWQSASMSNILATGAAIVNCPIVSVE
ncbi:MAG: hypothetical protein KDC88_11910 [Ignavibacteriae bacterium]|nr:hypothetical protein [Ignavibacteriota bacterium]MCB9258297.1 hypothetical protein [Ignavibacteriales bacterium]